MKATQFRRKRVVAGIAGALLGASAGAVAQDIRVEVTGSNIKRVEGEGALPVQVITRQEIERSGVTSTMELLDRVSANNSAGNVTLGNVIGAATFSNQTASLRGLGAQSTLVLINGKRLGTFSSGINGNEGVNLSAIPFSAIERVEVLKDGASAIYGSDAIGGVVNFITRPDFRGVEASARYDTPTHRGGGDQYTAQVSAGTGDLARDRYNAFASVYYQEQKPLLQSDRDFSRTNFIPSGASPFGTVSGQTFPGFISTGGIGSPDYPNCLAFNVAVGGRCRFDPPRYPGVEGLPDTKLASIFGSARLQLNADWQAYATALYSRQESRFIIQPNPLSDQVPTTATASGAADVLLPPTSPFYPHGAAAAAGVDGQPLNVRYRCVVCGNRDTTDTNEAWQALVGIKGSAWNWDWDGSLYYSENRATEHVNNGFFRYTQILPVLSSGRVNLFGPNTPDIQAEIDRLQFRDTTYDSRLPGYGLDLKGSGEVLKLPAGPVAVAAGVQATTQKLEQHPNPLLATGDVTGYGGNLSPVDHSRSQWAVFGEANVPVTRNLEVDAALRYDHYSDFGATTNPKVSVRWQPVQQLLVRGSWGTGFLAPTLFELWNPATPGLSQPGLFDPLRCPDPGNGGANPDCNAQYTVTFGGNPDLKPERSRQTTLGLVVEPVTGNSLGVDYFRLDLHDLLTNGAPIAAILDPQLIGQNAAAITRAATCSPSGFVPNAPCPITAIDQRFLNLGHVKITGFDVDGRFRLPATAWGRISGSISGSYYIRYDVQQPDGSFAGFVSNAFQAPNTGITPRWKHYAQVTWEYGPWSATLANNFQTSYIDVNPDVNGDLRRVDSLTTWDLQASYTGFRNWTLTLGAKNLFDANPPFTNQNLTFQGGYDPSYYDARARVVYAQVRYAIR